VNLDAPHLVIDGFLARAEHAALLEQTLRLGEAAFEQGPVRKGQDNAYREARTSRVSRDGLGPLEAMLEQAILARVPELCEELGVAPFAIARTELELVANGDGQRHAAHLDTFVGKRRGAETDRMLSLVYYFHRRPRGFTGGELALYPLGTASEPVLIDPADNRLLAFPSYVLHEVRPVACPGNAFEDWRFSVNAWIHRAQKSG
jgi:Rps23 Pro-64 3,4-dihydroxylase Tpa1-like proline 4-hydroxylase